MIVPDASKSSFVANPNKISADGHSKSTLTLKLLGADTKPVAGQKVTFHFDGPHDGIKLSEVIEDPAGTYTATITSTEPETTVLDAWVNDQWFNLPGATIIIEK
jgi:ethanolamine utilization protein EutP (predicted NTPase)